MSAYHIGQRVKLTKDIWEDADEFSPAGYLGRKGDLLTIKRLFEPTQFKSGRYISIAHDWVTNGASFGVTPDEIEVQP